MARIVLIGHDMNLLATRAALLRKTGSSVTCLSANAADALFEDRPFDIVVLCHTLNDVEVADLMGKVHGLWSRAKILRVVVGWDLEYSMKDGDVSNSTDPGRLLLKTKQLLEAVPDRRTQIMLNAVDRSGVQMASEGS